MQDPASRRRYLYLNSWIREHVTKEGRQVINIFGNFPFMDQKEKKERLIRRK